MVEVVRRCEDVVLAGFIGLAEIAEVVVSHGVVEGLIGDTRVVLFADLSKLLVVSQGTG
jgi:hypothetical protein